MNANELNKWIENSPYTEQEGVIVLLRQQQAEIERLTTKNLEWLANWNEQQAEIEALKKQCANYEILIASWVKE